MIADHTEKAAPEPPEPTWGRAAIVVEDAGHERRYAMFDIRRLTTQGVFLASGLFLELGEQVTLALSLDGIDSGDDGVEITAGVRVVGLDAGALPGMEVEFIDLRDDDRELIARCAQSAADLERRSHG